MALTLLCTSRQTDTHFVHLSYFPRGEKMTSYFQQEGLLSTTPHCKAQFLLLHKAPAGRLGVPRAGRHAALTSISAHAVQTAFSNQDQRALSTQPSPTGAEEDSEKQTPRRLTSPTHGAGSSLGHSHGNSPCSNKDQKGLSCRALGHTALLPARSWVPAALR